MAKNKLLPSIVLGSICLVVAALLALVNMLTAGQIQLNNDKKTEDALLEVLPDNTGFTKVELPESFPESIDLVKKSAEGGYVFRAVVTGKNSGLTVMIGIDKDGKIVGTKCTANQETPSYAEPVFDVTESGYYAGMTEGTFDAYLVAGSTLTSRAYANAVRDALLGFAALSGADVDLRTEEEKLADALNAALGTEGSEFERWFATDITGADAIYTEKSGAGVVIALGDSLVGIKDGAVRDNSDLTEELKAGALSAYSVYKGSTLTPIALPNGAPTEVTAAYLSNNGTYVFELSADGYGINGDPSYASGEPIKIKVAVAGDGVIISVITVSEAEDAAGSKCADSAFFSQFVDKDKDGIYAVADIDGAPVTSSAYKRALRHAFSVFEILSGGNV